MTTYHSESAPKALSLKPGELVVNADGSLDRSTTAGGLRILLSPADVKANGWICVEALARHLEGLGYTRVYAEAPAAIGPFPSGATLQVSGDKIVGRTAPEHGGGSGGIQRAPLPGSDAWRYTGDKHHDTFGADFIVTKGAEPTAPLYDSPTTDSAYPAISGLLRG